MDAPLAVAAAQAQALTKALEMQMSVDAMSANVCNAIMEIK